MTTYNQADQVQAVAYKTPNEVAYDFTDDAVSPIAGWWILPFVCAGAVGWFAALRFVFW